MARKSDVIEDDVEFVPSEVFVAAVNEPAPETDAAPIAPPLQADPGADAPLPERYRELRPWNRDTLTQRLNEAAADGWRLAAVVGYQIILEHAD